MCSRTNANRVPARKKSSNKADRLNNIWFSAFPTGGYSHSYGFESATKHGFVTDFSEYSAQLISFFSGIILIYHYVIFHIICSFCIDAFKVFVLSCLQNAGMLTGIFVLAFAWF